jgi:hypothetical protein
MQAIHAGQGSGCLASPAFERIAQPTLTKGGMRAPAIRFGDPRAQAPGRTLATFGLTVTGITNKSLRGWMTGLLGQPCTMTKASYDLARLSRNGLITRRPHSSTYDLTPDGQLFAIFYTKVHDHVLYPPHGRPAHHRAARTPPRPPRHRSPRHHAHRRRMPAPARLTPHAGTVATRTQANQNSGQPSKSS